MYIFNVAANGNILEIYVHSKDYNRPGHIEIKGGSKEQRNYLLNYMKSKPGIISHPVYNQSDNLVFPADIHHIFSEKRNDAGYYLVNMTGNVRKLTHYRRL